MASNAPPRRGDAPRSGSAPRHGAPRWTTSARFLVRSLNLRGRAFLLALLAVTVGATVTATVLNLKAGVKGAMSRTLRAYGPNLLVVPAAHVPGAGLNEAAVEQIRSLAPGAAVVPVLYAPGTVQDQGATLVGTDFEALRRLYPGWDLQGGMVRPHDCVVGVSLAARIGFAKGSIAALRAGGEESCRVAAFVMTGEAEDEQVFVPLAVLQEMTGRGGRVSLAALSISGGLPKVEEAAQKITRALPGVEARPARAIASAEAALLTRLDRMMLLSSALVLVLCGLCLVTTLMAMVVERTSEIGLARAVGAGDGEILKMFLGEMGLLAGTGAILGVIFGAIGARVAGLRLFGTALGPSPSVIPIVFGAALVLCLVSVLAPLRRALSIQPAEALRGD